MDSIWINTEFVFPPVKAQEDWTRVLHQKWFKHIVCFSDDLSLDGAVFSNFCLTLENYAETGYERAWKLQQEFYFQMIFSFMTSCLTPTTYILIYVWQIVNHELISVNVNSLDQLFLIYQAPFKYSLNKKTGMAEGLKIWSGE